MNAKKKAVTGKKFTFSISLFLATILCVACGKPEGNKLIDPNIILITIDALRADHLGVYWYPYQTSPHIDDFAKKSSIFEQAYCTIPKTSASIASLMTGLHPLVHKTKPNRGELNEKYITLAEALKLKGYFNFAILDNANLSQGFKFHQGFDYYKGVWNEIEDKKDSTPYITNTILDFLGTNKKAPFFLWAHYIEPHAPYMPPNQYVEERPKGRIINEIKQKVVVGIGEQLRDDSSEGHFLALYDGAVKYIDDEFGKIINLIFQKGYEKNTIIIISSDHGEELGEYNLFFDHGPLTSNSSTRIPLIVYMPGQKNRRIMYPVSLMDIYPTILSQVGLSVPYEIQGENLFENDSQRLLFISAVNNNWAVVYKNLHLVNINSPLPEILGLEHRYLFDIYKDPYEKENIVSQYITMQNFMEKKYWEFHEESTKRSGPNVNIKEPSLSEKELKNLKSLGYIR
jgi:arylsulfatase A-like enzyme